MARARSTRWRIESGDPGTGLHQGTPSPQICHRWVGKKISHLCAVSLSRQENFFGWTLSVFDDRQHRLPGPMLSGLWRILKSIVNAETMI